MASCSQASRDGAGSSVVEQPAVISVATTSTGETSTTLAPVTTTTIDIGTYLPADLVRRESLLEAFEQNAYVITHTITDRLGDSESEITSVETLQLQPGISAKTYSAPDGSHAALTTENR